jgi:serine/threonine protein kinase
MTINFTDTMLDLSPDTSILRKLCGDKFYKIYDLKADEVDEFDNTPEDYFKREIQYYQRLNGVTYCSLSGQEMSLTPQCFEIGQNYIVLSKYQTDMYSEIRTDGLFSQYSDLNHAINQYVIPIAHQLDSLGIEHHDFHPRNIVLDYDFIRCSIIDFGLVETHDQPDQQGQSTWDGMGYFLNDVESRLFYPELKEQICHQQ